MGILELGYLGTQKLGILATWGIGTWEFGYVHGNLDTWEFGYFGIWEFGNMGVRKLGYSGTRPLKTWAQTKSGILV